MIKNPFAGKKLTLVSAAVLLFFSASLWPDQARAEAKEPAFAETVQDVVAAVENHYRQVSSLSAKVTQKNHLKAIGKTQSFEAELRIKKPGRLRLDYTNGQVILVDGREALFYSKKNEQLIKKTFPDVEQMNIPVAFLLGAAHIRDDFEALQPDPKAPRSLELLPKKPGAAMKKIGMQTDEAGRITALTIFDRSGNTTELLFEDIREGVAIDDKVFAFKAPKGTEIIEQ
jgi:outer membrane lipoprotein carrier protein